MSDVTSRQAKTSSQRPRGQFSSDWPTEVPEGRNTLVLSGKSSKRVFVRVLGPVNTTSDGGDGCQSFSVRGARSVPTGYWSDELRIGGALEDVAGEVLVFDDGGDHLLYVGVVDQEDFLRA